MTLPEKIEKLKVFFQAMRDLEDTRWGYEDRDIDNSTCTSASYYVHARRKNDDLSISNLRMINEAETIIFGEAV